MPQPDQVTPAFLLLSFSPVATGFFSPPNKGDGERVFWGLQQRGDSGLPLGELARQAGWTEPIFAYTGCQCLSHTPPFTDSLTHPSFTLPLQLLPLCRPSLCFLVLARLWLLH